MNLSHQDQKEASVNQQIERILKITQTSIHNNLILPETTFTSPRDFIINRSLDICQHPIITISITALDSCHSNNPHSSHIITTISSLQFFLLIINIHLLRGILLPIGNTDLQTFNMRTITGSTEGTALQLVIAIWMVLIVIIFPLGIISKCQQFTGARLAMKDY